MNLHQTLSRILEEDKREELRNLLSQHKAQVQKTLRAKKGMTLFNALTAGVSVETVRLLIENGVLDVHLVNTSGLNCLAHCKSVEVAKLLIEAGADIHRVNSRRQDITEYLVWNGSGPELLQFYNQLLGRDVLPERMSADEPAFWDVLKAAIKKGLDSHERIAKEAVRLLQSSSIPEIIQFELSYRKLCGQCSTAEIWSVIDFLQGGCSDDDFLFHQRPWLISLGEKAFREILESPEVIAKHWNKNRQQFVNYTNIRCDSLESVGSTVYARKTGKEDLQQVLQARGDAQPETSRIDAARLRQLTDPQNRDLFFQTFPSLKK